MLMVLILSGNAENSRVATHCLKRLAAASQG